MINVDPENRGPPWGIWTSQPIDRRCDCQSWVLCLKNQRWVCRRMCARSFRPVNSLMCVWWSRSSQGLPVCCFFFCLVSFGKTTHVQDFCPTFPMSHESHVGKIFCSDDPVGFRVPKDFRGCILFTSAEGWGDVCHISTRWLRPWPNLRPLKGSVNHTKKRSQRSARYFFVYKCIESKIYVVTQYVNFREPLQQIKQLPCGYRLNITKRGH